MAENPFRRGLIERRTAHPCTMVIFGATGDLTARKLIPALYNLSIERRLPPGFSVIGFARRDWDDDAFRRAGLDGINSHSRRGEADTEIWDDFSGGMGFIQASFDDAEGYRKLRDRLEEIEKSRGSGRNRIFYLATPPRAYAGIIRRLGEAGLVYEGGDEPFSRIIIEKPFGHDLASARELNGVVAGSFRESQVFRIDHYLGKETVQNILVLRFANGIFEPIWNRKYVDHVQITAAETLGVEGRGGYFNDAGSLRDMVQNHMMQLLCLMAMEPPASLGEAAVRNEKVKVLEAIPVPSAREVPVITARGQYAAGSVAGELVPGFREEEGVPADSRTETFVALRLAVENWRWAGVPFYLRTGKRLPRRVTEVAIHFKAVPHLLFEGPGSEGITPNVLTLRIQPDEGISLKFSSKVPGSAMNIRPVKMDFRYGTSFGEPPPEAYERLILDALIGDGTLFTRRDEVEAAWGIMTSILDGWAEHGEVPIPAYEAATWGPPGARELLERDGRSWRRL